MISLNFVDQDGRTYPVEAEVGRSVMQAATRNMVPGIVADCGGAGACATCHGYVHPDWMDRVPPPTRDEKDMIEAGCFHVEGTSRLTCQITVTEDMDGLVVALPPAQGI